MIEIRKKKMVGRIERRTREAISVVCMMGYRKQKHQ
jgi:hypothetical protein